MVRVGIGDGEMRWISSRDCPWPINLLMLPIMVGLGTYIWCKNTITHTDLMFFAWSVWATLVNVEELLRKLGDE